MQPERAEIATLTPTQIQEMINSSVASAFTSMGINGLSLPLIASPAFHSSSALNTSITHTTWFLDLGASNHMTTDKESLTLSNVYFVPKLSANLISAGQLVDCGYLVNFSSSGCGIQEWQTGKVIGTGSKHARLFLLDMRPSSFFATSMSVLNKLWTIWHRRLGHLNNASLIQL